MSYTLIDYFNAFQIAAREKRLSAGVRSAYYAILAEFNTRRFPQALTLSARDLKELAGLASVATAHEAKNVLKNQKLIDFETKGGTTTYKLGTEHIRENVRTNGQIRPNERQAAHQPNGDRTPGGGLNMPARADRESETETVQLITTAGAGAREERNGESGGQSSSERTPAASVTAVASASAAALPLSSASTADALDIFKVWERETQLPLFGDMKYDLLAMAENNFELTERAIKKAMRSKSTYFLRFDHFEDVYNELKNGGDGNGKSKASSKARGGQKFGGNSGEIGSDESECDTRGNWLYS